MRSTPRCRLHSSRAFSLVELSVVVAIMSVVTAFGLEAAANFVNRTATSISRERLKVVDDAVAQFFRVYGRLPCPAARSYDPLHLTGGVYDYGLEACATSIQIAAGGAGNGLYAGAVPFRALNLPMMYSLDGFSNKLNYVVTANLTNAGGGPGVYNRFASSGGTSAQNGIGGIEVDSGQLYNPCGIAGSNCDILADPTASTGAAYFLFSSGADQRGAVSERGVARVSCTSPYFAAKADYRPDSFNCVFGSASTLNIIEFNTMAYNRFYDNRYNNGLNLVSYFDDVAIWRTKAQL